MRVLYRGALPEGAIFRLQTDGATVLEKPLLFWGNFWGSDGWIADFSDLTRHGAFTLTLEMAYLILRETVYTRQIAG